MKALVEVRDEWDPHTKIAELPRAFDVDRVLTRRGRGAFAFNVPSRGLLRGTLYEGRIIVIRSTERFAPYVGVVTQIEEDVAAGVVEVSGDNYTSVLFGMALDASVPVSNRGAGDIARRLLHMAQSNGRSINVQPGRLSGRPIVLAGSVTLDFGAQHLGSALDTLVARTNDEWWIEHRVTDATLEHYLYLQPRRGIDRPDVLLYEGRDFSVAQYKRDALGALRSAITVGGGGPIAGRTSAAVSASAGSLVSAAGRVVPSDGTPVSNPLIARDLIEHAPLESDPSIVADNARRSFERPRTARESLRLVATVRAAQDLRVGDTVRAQFYTINYGGINRALRVSAMQPDEARGECDLAVEVS